MFNDFHTICHGSAPTDQPAKSPSQAQQVTCDQEAWVLDRLQTLVVAALKVADCQRVDADGPTIDAALDGMLHGTAAELIRTLGKMPAYMNIRKISLWPK